MKKRRLVAVLTAFSLSVSLLTDVGRTAAYAGIDSKLDTRNLYNIVMDSVVDSKEGVVGLESIGTTSEDLVFSELVNIGEPSESGYQATAWVDSEGNIVDMTKSSSGLVKASVDLPASFRSSYNTSIKSQGALGLCWAHATIACTEASMIAGGYDTEEMVNSDTGDVNFSEKHLAWFTYGVNSSIEGDPLYEDGDAAWGLGAYDMPGNAEWAAGTLARWSGVELENNVPYSDFNEVLNENIRYNSYGHLQDTRQFDCSDRASVKSAIMENGAVYVGYNSVDANYKTVTYNGEETYSFYKKDNEKSNHAVTIIGWDDNYPKENFVDTPANNGAWLCKNSWSSWWGAQGYFYMSYEEPTLQDMIALYMEPADNYDNIYQYDALHKASVTSTGDLYGMNVFEAKGDELLEAVSFYTIYPNSTYTIKVYKNFSGTELTFVDEPTLTISGTESYSGYHTIEFSEGVLLQKGEKYAIALMTAQGDTKYVCFDGYSSEVGQSYYYYDDGSARYTDAYTTYKRNVCIKAFTSDVEGYDLSRGNVVIDADSINYNGQEIFYTGRANVPVYGSSDMYGVTVEEGAKADVTFSDITVKNVVANGDMSLSLGGTSTIESLKVAGTAKISFGGLSEIATVTVDDSGSLTVTGNSMLDVGTVSGDITIENSFAKLTSCTGSVTAENSLVWIDDTMTVYGTYALAEAFTVPEGVTLTVGEGAIFACSKNIVTNNGIIDILYGGVIRKDNYNIAYAGDGIVNNGTINRYMADSNYIIFESGNVAYGASKISVANGRIRIIAANGENCIYNYSSDYLITVRGDATVAGTVESAIELGTGVTGIYVSGVTLDKVSMSADCTISVAGTTTIDEIVATQAVTCQLCTLSSSVEAGTINIGDVDTNTRLDIIEYGNYGLYVNIENLNGSSTIYDAYVNIQNVNATLTIKNGTIDITKLNKDIVVTGGSVKIADAGTYKVYDGRNNVTACALIPYYSTVEGYEAPSIHNGTEDYIYVWYNKNANINGTKDGVAFTYTYGTNSLGIERWLKIPTANDFSINIGSLTQEYTGKALAPTVEAEGINFTLKYINYNTNESVSEVIDTGVYGIYADIAVSEDYAAATDVKLSDWMFTVTGVLLNDCAITGIDAPVSGVKLDTTAEDNSGRYTVARVEWMRGDIFSVGKAKYDAVYTVNVVVDVNANYSISMSADDMSATINGVAAKVTINDANTFTLTYTFPKTEAAKLESIELVSAPDKTEYEMDEELTVSGGVIALNYEDGRSEVIDITADMVSGFDSTVAGEQTLTVTYEGCTCQFVVFVIAEETYIYGDADGSGEVDIADGVVLKKHLAGIIVDINLDACDINADGKTDVSDAVLLMKHLAGYDVVFGTAEN